MERSDMSVANLYNVPRSPQEWSVWTFSNANSHILIVQAMRDQLKVKGLETFALDPLPQTDFANFLLRHQVMHNQLAILGIAVSDYTGVNPEDLQGLEFLWFLHGNEHRLAHQRLRINN
jgi:hypothetical protein